MVPVPLGEPPGLRWCLGANQASQAPIPHREPGPEVAVVVSGIGAVVSLCEHVSMWVVLAVQIVPQPDVGRIDAERNALDAAARALIERGIATWTQDGDARPVLIVRGQARLLDEAASEDLERVRLLLDELEGKQEIARLLDSARDGEATRIFIGSENKLFALSGSSVIAKPVRALDGQVVGVVGVIGPTRLNYGKIIPIVDYTAKLLGKLMD